MYKKELLTYSSFIHEYSKVTFVNDVRYIIELKEAIGNNMSILQYMKSFHRKNAYMLLYKRQRDDNEKTTLPNGFYS